jgi:predicted kinase
MSGAPGSRESTLANLLAKSLNGIVIDHDLLRSFFLNSQTTFEQAAKLSYNLQFVFVKDLLKQGRSVIIDSTCNFPETLEQGISIGKEVGVEYVYVECRVDDIRLLDERLTRRVPMRSQRRGVERPPVDAEGGNRKAKEDYYKLFERWIEHPCRPENGGIVVDSRSSPEECLGFVLERIGVSK